MEIRRLKTFKKVAEVKSFSKAAKQLNYGQSTVTEHIQLLEKEIGAALFDRLGKKISITSIGEQLYSYVVELLYVYDKIENISEDKKNLSGHISIGASESIIIYKLQPVLSKFRKKYPNVDITLISANCSKLKEKLYTGEIDLTITIEPTINNKDLIINKIDEEPLIFVSGIENKIIKLSKDNKDEINNQCMIFTEKQCAIRTFFDNYLYIKEITPKSTFEFSNIEAIKQCVVSEIGISLLPLMCVQQLIDNKKMKKIETDQDFKFSIQLCYHKNKWISPLLKKFIKYCLEMIPNV